MIACRFCTEADLFDWRQAIFTSTCVQCEDRMLASIADKPPEPDELKCIRDGYRLMAKQLMEAQ